MQVNTTPSAPWSKRYVRGVSATSTLTLKLPDFILMERNPGNTPHSTRNIWFPGTAFFKEDLRGFFDARRAQTSVITPCTEACGAHAAPIYHSLTAGY